MRLLSIISLLVFIGCSASKEILDTTPPQILIQQPLPPPPESLICSSFPIDFVIYILQDGSVEQVIMRKGIGDAPWDSASVSIIKQWRFLPARRGTESISTWYYIHTNVQFATPIYMTLAEIQCSTLAQVDSAYAQLVSGKTLSQLVSSCCIDTVREITTGVNRINIYQYPEHIRKGLVKLDINEFSHPMPLGDRFIIFQRL